MLPLNTLLRRVADNALICKADAVAKRVKGV
jgi:hypothetical protein